MSAAGTRKASGKFRRLGRGAQLTAIVLVALFVAGLVLIADGLLLKAESQRSDAGAGPLQLTDRSVFGGPGALVRSR